MTLGLPVAGAFDFVGISKPNSTMPAQFALFLEFVRGLWGLDETTFQIASASIAPDRMRCVVDTGTGAPAAANLDAIATANLPIGWPLILRSADPARVPTVRHGRGTTAQVLLSNGSDYPLVSTTQRLLLVREASGWVEQWRFDGTAQGTFRSYYGLSTAATYPAATNTEAITGTATDRLIVAAALRAVLLDKAWMQALTAFTGTLDLTKWVLYDDGTTLWRLPVATALAGSLRAPFVSGELTIGNGTSDTVSHGLGVVPRLLTGILRCKTVDTGPGFAVGDEVDVQSLVVSGTNRAITLWSNSSQVGYNCAAQSNPTAVLANDGSVQVMDPTKWRLVLRCWS